MKKRFQDSVQQYIEDMSVKISSDFPLDEAWAVRDLLNVALMMAFRKCIVKMIETGSTKEKIPVKHVGTFTVELRKPTAKKEIEFTRKTGLMLYPKVSFQLSAAIAPEIAQEIAELPDTVFSDYRVSLPGKKDENADSDSQ